MTIDSRMASRSALLQLLQLCSPSLPIGGFAWSQGLEYAIDAGWLKGEADIVSWLEGMLEHSFAYLDLPVLYRLHDAWCVEDLMAVAHWNSVVLASRETRELLLEDEQMGLALRRLLLDLGFASSGQLGFKQVSYVTCFAFAAVHFGIDRRSMGLGFVWGWLENQIAAAIKVVPLGQTSGQRIFHELVGVLESVVDVAFGVEDDEVGMSLPGQVMASMLHEEQYSRLFRS